MERPVTTDDPSPEARTRALDERTPRRRRARDRAREPLWREGPGGFDPDYDVPHPDDAYDEQDDRSSVTEHVDDLDDLPPSRIATSALDAPDRERLQGAGPLGGLVLNR